MCVCVCYRMKITLYTILLTLSGRLRLMPLRERPTFLMLSSTLSQRMVCLLQLQAGTPIINDNVLLYYTVPCYRRCRQMSVIPENEKVIKFNQDDEGWVDTHHGISETMNVFV